MVQENGASLTGLALDEENRAGLEIKDLWINLGGRQIIKGLSLELKAGQVVTIIGPNGAGKSTLLRSILGAFAVKQEILLGGVPIGELSIKDRARCVAYVPQRPALPSQMKLFDYVMLGRTPHISPWGRETKADLAIAAEVLSHVGLSSLSRQLLGTLSGGEAQLAVIARCLCTQSKILLLDEPTSSLDLKHRMDIVSLIESLPNISNVSVLMTMHDLNLAGLTGGRLALLAEGQIAAAGSAAEVLTRENILHHYGIKVEVISQNGGISVLPEIHKSFERNPGDDR